MRISDWSSDVCSSDLTHPLSIQRMSDIQNRVAELPVVHHKDSDAFWYVRAKLRVLQAQDNQAQRNAMAKLRLDAQQTGGVEQSAAWYGLAYADWQRKDLSAAQEALAKAQQGGRSSPEIAALSVALALEKGDQALARSEEHTSELQSLMRISYAVFCLKKKRIKYSTKHTTHNTSLALKSKTNIQHT